MEALHGDLGLVPEAGPGHLEPADVPLRLERQAAVIVGQVDRAEEAVAQVDRALVEVEEDGRGVGGGLVVLGGLDRGPQGQGGLVGATWPRAPEAPTFRWRRAGNRSERRNGRKLK